MEILNLGNNSEDSVEPVTPKSKKLKVAKAAVGIGTLASLTGLGSTLAANISLNNDANVEFGQGVAQTAACDEDGFTITPVSYYDAAASTFRLDYVEVSGLNLTPVGSNFESDPSTSYLDSSSNPSLGAAILAHPGQYYDTTDNAWTNTCDQVVLDFKAYTDVVGYQLNTADGYAAVDNGDPLPNTVSSPLLWNVYGNGGAVNSSPNAGFNSDIAIVFGANDDANYGTNGLHSDGGPGSLNNIYTTVNIGTTWPSSFDSNTSFQFFPNNGHHQHGLSSWGYTDENVDPVAGAISKITVESMKYFPSDYYVANDPGYGVRP